MPKAVGSITDTGDGRLHGLGYTNIASTNVGRSSDQHGGSRRSRRDHERARPARHHQRFDDLRCHRDQPGTQCRVRRHADQYLSPRCDFDFSDRTRPVSTNRFGLSIWARWRAGGFTNLLFTVEPTNAGVLPFSASVGASGVTDTNTANNFASTNILVTNYLSGPLGVTDQFQSDLQCAKRVGGTVHYGDQ